MHPNINRKYFNFIYGVLSERMKDILNSDFVKINHWANFSSERKITVVWTLFPYSRLNLRTVDANIQKKIQMEQQLKDSIIRLNPSYQLDFRSKVNIIDTYPVGWSKLLIYAKCKKPTDKINMGRSSNVRIL